MTKIGPKEAALTALRASAATKRRKRGGAHTPDAIGQIKTGATEPSASGQPAQNRPPGQEAPGNSGGGASPSPKKPKKRNARRAPGTARKAPSRKRRPKVPVDPGLLAQSLADSALVTRAVEAYLRHRQRSKATVKASREKKVACLSG